MLRVLGRTVYTDGVLFSVKDLKTGQKFKLSEPSLGRYIQEKNVENATVVHKRGSRPFVRLAGGVSIKTERRPMPDSKDVNLAIEIFLAKKWFAAKGKALTPHHSAPVKQAVTPKPKTTQTAKQKALATIKEHAERCAQGNPYQRSDSEIEIGLDAEEEWYTINDYSEERGGSEIVEKVVPVSTVDKDKVRQLCDENGWYITF